MANPYAPPIVDEDFHIPAPADYRSTHTLSMVLRGFLGGSIVVTLITLVHSFAQIELLERMKLGRFTMPEAEANDERGVLIWGLYLLVFLATSITWVVWQVCTSKNARALGTEFMEFGPHAWGWFFCPIINFFRPLAVVKELWKVNDPNSADEPPGYFNGWWLTWVGGSILGNISARMAREDADIDQLTLGTQIDMISSVLLIVSAIFAIKVIAEIHRREQARARSKSA